MTTTSASLRVTIVALSLISAVACQAAAESESAPLARTTPGSAEASIASTPLAETTSPVVASTAAALGRRLSGPIEVRAGNVRMELAPDGRAGWTVPGAVRAATGELVTTTDDSGNDGDGDGGTVVRWLRDGEVTAVARPKGLRGLAPVAVSADGHTVALAEPLPPADSWAKGAIGPSRDRSVVALVDRRGAKRAERWELDGNFHPEAIASYITSPNWPAAVFLIEFVPASAPTHYRVRVLDTTTGEVGLPLNLRSKAEYVDEQMAGVSRNQVLARQRGVLFTLYRSDPLEGAGYSFIHTLGLTNGVWCIDLPAESGLADQRGTIALAPDEEFLYVASADGWIGEISTDVATGLKVGRTVSLGVSATDQPALAVSDESLFLAVNDFVVEVDRATMIEVGRASVAGPLRAIVAAPNGRVVAANPIGLYEFGPGLELQAELRSPAGVTELHPVSPGS